MTSNEFWFGRRKLVWFILLMLYFD